jgi:hypothetical protein
MMRNGNFTISRFIRFIALSCVFLQCLGLTGDGILRASEPLYDQIDRLILSGTPDYEQIAAPMTSDAKFLRRVSLDLTGMIPTAEQAREFLANRSSAKRSQLIARLLASPEYARHMQRMFDVMLMRRLPLKNVSTTEWETFLRKSFAENKPWDRIVQEILSADGSDPKQRGAARFYLDRGGDVNQITRDIGRIFLGADLECAQCHDHPDIDDYKQHHYYGISAFLVRSFLFTDKKSKKVVLAEKAEGEVSFISVFAPPEEKKKGNKSTKPKLFVGPVVAEPVFKKEDAYKVKPAKNVRPIPKFSRRALLPKSMTSPENRRFARTAVNRLWEMMMGRGLVHPVDFDHSDNPPSHPELLNILTNEFISHGYDIKWFLRELTLSKTYQRSSRVVLGEGQSEAIPPESFAQAVMKPLTPAQFCWAALQAVGETKVQKDALNEKLTEESLHKRMVEHENRFVGLFGGQPGNPPK